MTEVTMAVNGVRRTAEIEDRTLLVHFLRDHLRLTGTHVGCDTSQCGACVVHVNGRAVKSCTMFAVQANGDSNSDYRGVGAGWQTSSRSGGVPGTPCIAVRLLYARDGHDGRRHAGSPSTRQRANNPS